MSSFLQKMRDLDPKWILGTIIVLTIANMGWFLGEGMRRKTGLITADPYTYVRYAKNLANGKFEIDGVIADLTREYSPRPKSNREGVLGPIWNTSLTKDGGLVYTVAMGYPLFLSVLHRVGGMDLCAYSNFGLWASLFVIIFFICRELFDRKPLGTVVGVVACSLTPMFNYQTFAQMHYLWREPLFLNCLFGALLCLALYMRRPRLRYLLILGFLLGYAFSIKEANGIYAPPFGLALLLTPQFREQGMIKRIALMGVFFVIGCGPFLAQNYMATGNPFFSLQASRAFPSPFGETVGNGWRLLNYRVTPINYMRLYSKLAGFQYIYLIPILAGIVLLAYRRIGRVVLVMCALHMALYLGWGNAEFRHMYFITVPSALCFAVGVLVPLNALAQKYAKGWAPWILALVPIVVIAMHPQKWPVKYKHKGAMTSADASQFSKFLSNHIEEPALVLSHRYLRDILGTYTPYEVIRLSEMMELLDPERKTIHELLDDIRAKGINIYVIDNEDFDPKHRVGLNHMDRDQLLLTWNNRLEQVAEIPVDEFKIRGLARNQASMNILKLLPWKNTQETKKLTVPDEGAAFLELHLMAAQQYAAVTLDGNTIDPATYRKFNFVPLAIVGESVDLVVDGGDRRVPELFDFNRLIGWDDRILLRFGDDIHPSDALLWSDPNFRRDAPWSWRRFYDPFDLYIPVRASEDFFSVVGFGLRKIWIPRGDIRKAPDGRTRDAVISTVGPNGEQGQLLGEDGQYWMPLPAKNATEKLAEVYTLKITPPEDFNLKLTALHVENAWRKFEVPVTSETKAVAMVGRLIPEGNSDWFWDGELYVNDTLYKTNQAYIITQDEVNKFSEIIPVESGLDAFKVTFKGVGLRRPQYAAINDRVSLVPGTATHVLFDRGIYAGEYDGKTRRQYVWTKGIATMQVPFEEKYKNYRLVLEARDVSKTKSREVRIAVGGQSDAVIVNSEIAKHEILLKDLALSGRGLTELVLSCEAWSPATEYEDNDDGRELGVQIFSLYWEPTTP